MIEIPWNYKDIPTKPSETQLAFILVPQVESFFGGAAGGGKFLRFDDVVLTPFGFKKCQDLKVGDLILHPSGRKQKIVQLKAWETLEETKVTFHDGASCVVTDTHLWQAWRSGTKKSYGSKTCKFGEESKQVVETSQLKTWLDKALDQEKRGVCPNWPMIPVCKPQVFHVTSFNFCTRDPYQLGFWLGNGSWHTKKGKETQNITITSKDAELIANNFIGFSVDGDVHHIFYGEELLSWKQDLKRLGLVGKSSEDKFIPREYKLGSLETRTNILQGLLDSDGYVDPRGQIYYTSVSEQLVDDVKFVVESLGGIATKTSKIGSYKNSDGVTVKCKRCFELYIKLLNPKKYFRLDRKRDRCKDVDINMYRRVVNVEKTGTKAKGRCLTVSEPDGLYMTNDFIVTHNSEVLLMAALQHIRTPGYSSLILRRSFTELKQHGALLHRAKSWLSKDAKKRGIRYNAEDHTFVFKTVWPDGTEGPDSSLQFGFLGEYDVETRYQGAEYHFVGLDEGGHFENDKAYRYLFSRIRKKACHIHQLIEDEDGDMVPNYVDGCMYCKVYKSMPLRMRLAANPGGPGHSWIKNRFQISKEVKKVFNPKTKCHEERVSWVGKNKDRPFIPSKFTDNKFIDQKQYRGTLKNLDEIRRAQLEEGDWDISPDSRFKVEHIQNRFYEQKGDYYKLNSQVFRIKDFLEVFIVVDPAASTREGMIDTDFSRVGKSSDTAISVFGLTPTFDLIWMNLETFKEEIPYVISKIEETWKNNRQTNYGGFNVSPIIVEKNGLGIGPCQILANRGLPIYENKKLKDKIQNSHQAQIKMKQKKVWFPKQSPWLEQAMDQVFTWTGNPGMPDDIIDNLSDACNYVGNTKAGIDPQYENSNTMPEHFLGVLNPVSSFKLNSRY